MYLFGGPNNKDYSILGSILGSPYFGKLPSSTGSGISGQHVGSRDGRGIFLWGLGCIWKFWLYFNFPICAKCSYTTIFRSPTLSPNPQTTKPYLLQKGSRLCSTTCRVLGGKSKLQVFDLRSCGLAASDNISTPKKNQVYGFLGLVFRRKKSFVIGLLHSQGNPSLVSTLLEPPKQDSPDHASLLQVLLKFFFWFWSSMRDGPAYRHTQKPKA